MSSLEERIDTLLLTGSLKTPWVTWYQAVRMAVRGESEALDGGKSSMTSMIPEYMIPAELRKIGAVIELRRGRRGGYQGQARRPGY